MKSVFMISTYGDFFWSFERGNISLLKELGFKVYLVANFTDDKFNHKYAKLQKLDVEFIDIPFERSPFRLATIKNFVQLKRITKDELPSIIDCHLAVVGVLSRLACWNIKNVKVIYSPHGFFFYKGCSIFNSIVYKTIETLLAKKTDALITINSEDYDNAKKMQMRGKPYYVPGVGVDVNCIIDTKIDEPYLHKLIGCDENDYLLISVGELSKNKNHIVVIEALKILLDQGINNIHYIICGRDDSEKEIIYEKVNECGLNKRFHYLGFRTDIIELNKQADCFVLPSFKEGLSVSIVEAMACGLPVIASRIRGNVDLIDEGKGGYLFSPHDSRELAECIMNMIKLKGHISMCDYNLNKCKQYSTEIVKDIMQNIYKSIDGEKNEK